MLRERNERKRKSRELFSFGARPPEEKACAQREKLPKGEGVWRKQGCVPLRAMYTLALQWPFFPRYFLPDKSPAFVRGRDTRALWLGWCWFGRGFVLLAQCARHPGVCLLFFSRGVVVNLGGLVGGPGGVGGGGEAV